MKRLVLAMLLVSPILGACQTMGGGSAQNIDTAVCRDWHGQHWAATDNPQTIADAKSNNAGHKVWCGS